MTDTVLVHKLGFALLVAAFVLFITSFSATYWTTSTSTEQGGRGKNKTVNWHSGLWKRCKIKKSSPDQCSNYDYKKNRWVMGPQLLESLAMLLVFTSLFLSITLFTWKGDHYVTVLCCRSGFTRIAMWTAITSASAGVLGGMGTAIFIYEVQVSNLKSDEKGPVRSEWGTAVNMAADATLFISGLIHVLVAYWVNRRRRDYSMVGII